MRSIFRRIRERIITWENERERQFWAKMTDEKAREADFALLREGMAAEGGKFRAEYERRKAAGETAHR